MTMNNNRRRGIPSNIERDHIERSIKEIDKNGVNKKGESTRWDLAYGDRRYPPKYVVSMANRYANGIDLDYKDFVSHMARRLLERQGYSIVAKRS